MSKLWGGRFAKATDELVHRFNASIIFDVRLYDEDITGSIAWARALKRASLLTEEETETLVAGLERIRTEFENTAFPLKPNDEDVHTAIERRLTELVGAVGGKLHTGRSRNDQVATDFRLWVMGACDQLETEISALQKALIRSAEEYLALPMPGYTHLQHAQPVTWGHWVLSHFWPLVRDRQRIKRVREDTAVLPLGSAALAGTAFAIDRPQLAEELGFHTISDNSLDAVSDRDFVADFLYAGTLLGIHLSRLAEQLIIYSSREFQFVTLDDAYSTGSSLMPQKKNPDTLELTRGKSGRLIGRLTGFLATLKGLPSAYDKDLQEDKEPVFDVFDNLTLILPVMTGVIDTLTINPSNIAVQLEPGLLATDLADYLVKQGVPFRHAHELVGQAVQLAESKSVPLTKLSLEDLQTISPQFEAGVMNVFDVKLALENRSVTGGTAPQAIRKQLEKAKVLLP